MAKLIRDFFKIPNEKVTVCLAFRFAALGKVKKLADSLK